MPEEYELVKLEGGTEAEYDERESGGEESGLDGVGDDNDEKAGEREGSAKICHAPRRTSKTSDLIMTLNTHPTTGGNCQWGCSGS